MFPLQRSPTSPTRLPETVEVTVEVNESQKSNVSLPPLNFPLLADGVNLEKIPVYSSSGELTYLSHQEFHAKFGCHYSESFFMSHQNLQVEFPNDLNRTVTEYDTKARETFRTPCTSVALYDTGNADMCYGCKAIEDIPWRTCVLVYTGVMSLYQGSDKNSSYAHNLSNGLWVDSKKVGGLARFINHSPSNIEQFKWTYRIRDEQYVSSLEDAKLKTQLNKILDDPSYFEQSLAWRGKISNPDFCSSVAFMDQSSQSELATANLQAIPVNINGIPTVALFASRDIEKGTILGYDYGLAYWKSEAKTPTYFKKKW